MPFYFPNDKVMHAAVKRSRRAFFDERRTGQKQPAVTVGHVDKPNWLSIKDTEARRAAW